MTLEENFVQPMRQKLVSQCGFYVGEDDRNGLYKQINDHFGLVFFQSVEYPPMFGFYHFNGKAFSPVQKSKLTGLLEREEFANFLEEDFEDWGAEWIIKKIHTKDYKDDFGVLVDILIKRYKLLELEVESIEV